MIFLTWGRETERDGIQKPSLMEGRCPGRRCVGLQGEGVGQEKRSSECDQKTSGAAASSVNVLAEKSEGPSRRVTVWLAVSTCCSRLMPLAAAWCMRLDESHLIV